MTYTSELRIGGEYAIFGANSGYRISSTLDEDGGPW